MGLVEILETKGSNLSKFNGTTPSIPVGATDQSTLHNRYSLSGFPNQTDVPTPSSLDIGGASIGGGFVNIPKYLDTDQKANSTLHKAYSINGDPNNTTLFFGTAPLPSPSVEDLDGIDVPKYLDTDPKANSTLHKQYSVNGDPNNTSTFFGTMPLPSPAGLDLNGIDVPKYIDTDPKANSTLHKAYSINGNPNMTGMFFGTMPLPNPTGGPTQDLDGIDIPKYLDTDPKVNSRLHNQYSIIGLLPLPNNSMFFGAPAPAPSVLDVNTNAPAFFPPPIPRYLDNDPKANSTLHKQYSINGDPNNTSTFFGTMPLPSPAGLDLNGINIPKYLDNDPKVNSKLHNEYSSDGNPNLTGFPQPSLLDLDKQPKKYLDTPPQ